MSKRQRRATKRATNHTSSADGKCSTRSGAPAQANIQPVTDSDGYKRYTIRPAHYFWRMLAFAIDAFTIYVFIITTKFIFTTLNLSTFVWHPEATTQDILLIVAYFVLPTGFWGRTLGKWATGIIVVDEHGRVPGIAVAIAREIAFKVISAGLVLMGFVWIVFDARHQGIHDKLGSTYVVYDPNSKLITTLQALFRVKNSTTKSNA